MSANKIRNGTGCLLILVLFCLLLNPVQLGSVLAGRGQHAPVPMPLSIRATVVSIRPNEDLALQIQGGSKDDIGELSLVINSTPISSREWRHEGDQIVIPSSVFENRNQATFRDRIRIEFGQSDLPAIELRWFEPQPVKEDRTRPISTNQTILMGLWQIAQALGIKTADGHLQAEADSEFWSIDDDLILRVESAMSRLDPGRMDSIHLPVPGLKFSRGQHLLTLEFRGLAKGHFAVNLSPIAKYLLPFRFDRHPSSQLEFQLGENIRHEVSDADVDLIPVEEEKPDVTGRTGGPRAIRKKSRKRGPRAIMKSVPEDCLVTEQDGIRESWHKLRIHLVVDSAELGKSMVHVKATVVLDEKSWNVSCDIPATQTSAFLLVEGIGCAGLEIRHVVMETPS